MPGKQPNNSGQDRGIAIRDLYPDLNDDQLRNAATHLHEYFDFVFELYERIRRDPEAYERFRALTKARRNPGKQRITK
jgi:hypothetical protein